MPRSARAEGLSRCHRFSTQGSFGPVLRSARKLRGNHVVLHVVHGSGPESRLGVALTRRLVPSSVHRNRIKRILREIFRRHRAKHAGLDIVVTLRNRWNDEAERAFSTEFEDLMRQAEALGR